MSNGIRQFHRWMGVAFTIGVTTYTVTMMTMAQPDPAHPAAPPWWMGLFAAVPLLLLEITGLYLFVLPYATKWRSKRAT